MVLEEVGHDRKAVLAEVVPNSFALAAVVQTEDQSIAPPMEVQTDDPNIAPMEVQMCTVVDHYTLVVVAVVGLTFVAEA